MNAFVKKIVDEIGNWANGKFVTSQKANSAYQQAQENFIVGNDVYLGTASYDETTDTMTLGEEASYDEETDTITING